MRISLTNKKILSTVAAIIGGIVLVCGAIMDVPDAIVRVISSGPSILSSPNTWWVIAVAAVEGTVLFMIWKQPGTDDGDEIRTRYDLFKEALKTATLREVRFYEWLVDIEGLQKAALQVKGPEHVKYILNVLQVVYQARIVELLRPEFQQTYWDALNYSKEQSGNLAIVMQTVIPLIENEIIQELEKEGERARPRPKPDSPN